MDAKSSDSPDSAKAVNYALDTKFSSNDILGSKSKKSSGSFIVCSSSSKSSSPPMRSSRSFLSSPKLEPLEKRSVFISYNAGEPDVVEKVNILRKRLIAKDKVVFLNPGVLGESDDDSDRLPADVRHTMKSCAVLVICVSRGYKTNVACQRIARYAVTQEKRSVLLFALLQGDYTMSSTPEVVSGWLGHMIKDAVTYPCFSNLQLKQTVSCIEGVLVYRKKQIVVDEKEVDKFAARCLEVKRMIARQQSKDELARSRSNFEEGIITKPASPSNSTRRLNPLKSPK